MLVFIFVFFYRSGSSDLAAASGSSVHSEVLVIYPFFEFVFWCWRDGGDPHVCARIGLACFCCGGGGGSVAAGSGAYMRGEG